jgi:hypothetical protein
MGITAAIGQVSRMNRLPADLLSAQIRVALHDLLAMVRPGPPMIC